MENKVEPEAKEVNPTDNLKLYRGARVLWPPESPDDMLNEALEQARKLLEENDIDCDGAKIAEQMKKFMDEKYEPYWHIVCGRHFGCYAIHESRRFLYFYIEGIAFLLYKSG